MFGAAKHSQEVGVHEHIAWVYLSHLLLLSELRQQRAIHLLDVIDDTWDVVVSFGPVRPDFLVDKLLDKVLSCRVEPILCWWS